MKILYLGFWNAADPLTRATIYPHLKILQDLDFISEIVFVNTERTSAKPQFTPDFESTKIVYRPIFSKNHKWGLLNKIADFIQFPGQINELISRHGIDMIIARGAPAGALAYLCYKKTRVPFIVESFEPHAEYMRESGVWGRFDLRYVYQKKWERKQKKFAIALLPVAENYRMKLLDEGLAPEKIITVPCSINASLFFPDDAKRRLMRTKFALADEDVVGIYAGKFGGLYLQEESFRLYEGAFRYFKNFYLVILSPPEFHAWIRDQLAETAVPLNRVWIGYVPHGSVPDYLNMSDFAFASYKTGSFKKFLSPVKVAEFWGCGLPVILTKGTGDESGFIERKSAGVLFDPDDINSDDPGLYMRLEEILNRPHIRQEMAALAAQVRDPLKAADAYKRLLSTRL